MVGRSQSHLYPVLLRCEGEGKEKVWAGCQTLKRRMRQKWIEIKIEKDKCDCRSLFTYEVGHKGAERRGEGTCTRVSTYDTERNWGRRTRRLKRLEKLEKLEKVDVRGSWRLGSGMVDDRNCYQKRRLSAI